MTMPSTPDVAGSPASRCWAAVLEACSPDATKALLMGEFTTAAPQGYDGPGITVNWTTIKEIQAAILEQVKINMGFRCEYCGNTDHILTLRDRGKRSCCGKRWMMPPNTKLTRPASESVPATGDDGLGASDLLGADHQPERKP